MATTSTILTFLTVLLVATLSHGRRHCQTYLIERHSRDLNSWEGAKAFCARHGMSLVKIDNEGENQRITDLLRTERSGRRQEGWWIGGIHQHGRWHWADGSLMIYQNFPPELGFSGNRVSTLTNYAAIFKDSQNGLMGTYEWGYVSGRSSNRFGVICETTRCF